MSSQSREVKNETITIRDRRGSITSSITTTYSSSSTKPREDNWTVKKIKKFFSYPIDFFLTITRLKGENYFSRLKKSILIFLTFFIAFLCFVIVLIRLASLQFDLIFFLSISLGIGFLSIVLLYVLTKWYQVFVFLILLIMYIGLVLGYTVQSEKGLHNNSSIFYSFIFPSLNIMLETNRYQKIFWNFVYVSYLVVIFIFEMIVNPKKVTFEDSMERRMEYFNNYCAIFISIGLFLFISNLYIYVIQRNNKVVRNIVESIVSLDLDSKFIQKLLLKEDDKCSELLLLMKVVIKNMKRYKSYLPTDILEDKRTQERKVSISKEDDPEGSSIDVQLSLTFSELRNKETLHVDQSKSLYQNASRLEYREVSLIGVDVTDFQLTVRLFQPGEIIKFYDKYVGGIETIVNKYKGSIGFLLGDRLICTFNSLEKKNLSHQVKAAKAALKISKLKIKMSEYWLQFRVAVVSGTFLYGNVGSENFKRFVYLSKTVNILKSFLRIFKVIKQVYGNVRVLANERVVQTVKFNIEYEQVEIGKMIKLDEIKFVNVYNLLETFETKEIQGGEWLYEIQEHLNDASGLSDHKKKIWEYYVESKIGKIKKLLELFPPDDKFKEYFQKRMKEKPYYLSMEIPYPKVFFK